MPIPDASFVLGSDNLFRAPNLLRLSWLSHAFGTSLHSPPPACTVRQIHSAQVVLAGAWEAENRPEGDALISSQPGLAIGVRTADCVPILLADPKHRAIAAIHAGWRGTAAEIARITVEHMSAKFQSDPSDLVVAIGPAIGPCCYQTSQEIAERFRRWNAVVADRYLDLGRANQSQLETAGVTSENILNASLCTRCNPGWFYSYRRDANNPGRMLSTVNLLS